LVNNLGDSFLFFSAIWVGWTFIIVNFCRCLRCPCYIYLHSFGHIKSPRKHSESGYPKGWECVRWARLRIKFNPLEHYEFRCLTGLVTLRLPHGWRQELNEVLILHIRTSRTCFKCVYLVYLATWLRYIWWNCSLDNFNFVLAFPVVWISLSVIDGPDMRILIEKYPTYELLPTITAEIYSFSSILL
jgi:hypothetical protein